MTPSRRRLLTTVDALARYADTNAEPHAAYILSCLQTAIADGSEADLAHALEWILNEARAAEAEPDDDPLPLTATAIYPEANQG